MATRPGERQPASGAPSGYGSPVPEQTSASSSDGSLGVRWIRPQRSLPVLSREACKDSLWSLQDPIELPSYTSSADFVGKVEVYKSRYSVVWSCYCRQTNHPVVVKAYEKKKMTVRHKKNAAREISILKMLQLSTRDERRFPGVVGFLGTFEDRYYTYIVQDKCGRGDLFKELIRKGGTMEESRVCTEVVVPLLLTLQYLHSRRIVHRDIKPENIFFTHSDELKLGDFGLAINLATDTPVSRVGTLDYMAPEVLAMPTPQQIQDEGLDVSTLSGYNEKVDVWALGVLVYELLAGRPPFEVEDPDQTAMLIMHANLEHFPPQMGPYATSFISQALVKQPAARQSARDLLQHPWVRQHYQVGANMYPPLHNMLRGLPGPSSSSQSSQEAVNETQPLNREDSSGSSGDSFTSSSDQIKLFVPRKRACGSVTAGTEESDTGCCTCSVSAGRKALVKSGAGVRPVSAISSRQMKPLGDKEAGDGEPRRQSCPGGSLSLTTCLLAEEEAEAAKQRFQGAVLAGTVNANSYPAPSALNCPSSAALTPIHPLHLNISISVPSPKAPSPHLSPSTPSPKTPDFELDKELLAAWREHQSRPPARTNPHQASVPTRSGCSFNNQVRVSPFPASGASSGLNGSVNCSNSFSSDSRSQLSRFGTSSSVISSPTSTFGSPSPSTPSPQATRLSSYTPTWSDRKPASGTGAGGHSSQPCKQPPGNTASSLNQNRFMRYIEKQNI
mmetsp:Transcript_9745/g.27861  ORF Transcript_9745/g.27861 Transcript_9745/m.27861 type:complete len:729 (-) Transcript_9745:367-2553(-)|eukprot:CAMPEP_0117675354 /NCGR_PEP_ID=MMETSP0804-20121206/15557_1 /TAXON_ID=1074897 /ORGANISM="Tetraselmis astigmatica, Strain CCMP880" /LENGTH=728 /DNA_ID=CAMNT_0005484345 /DNA_START=880 /DNA_END=3066 /DNA_ORIENTATION=+